jgi:glycolate oxidase iron-sulfur subunit
MQTNLAEWIKDTPEGIEANAILRKCVHCGFCLATCPTYQLVGDELDSPRGRIYLIKQMLEGEAVTERTQHHLDRCLTCRACETTCPSGVQYGRLVDIGRHVVEQRVPRPAMDKAKRAALRAALPKTALFGAAVRMGRWVKPLLPGALQKKLPTAREAGVWPAATHARRMIVLNGCVQPVLGPDIDAALARVLDRCGVSLIPVRGGGCCGAISHHLNAHEAALQTVRSNIDAWWPHVEAGVEGIVVTSSGCGAMVAEYGHMLRNDPVYAEKAARVAALFCDTSAALAKVAEDLASQLHQSVVSNEGQRALRIAFHSPCSLQHGLKIRGTVEGWLLKAGFELTHVPDSHLCCGSAGTYSLLQPELSQQLLSNKVKSLEAASPDLVATANIGCLTHIESGLQSSSKTPIHHWIEIIDRQLAKRAMRTENA